MTWKFKRNNTAAVKLLRLNIWAFIVVWTEAGTSWGRASRCFCTVTYMLIIHSHIQSSSELRRQTETCPERLITRSPSKVGLPVFGFETFSVVDSYWIWPLDFYPNKTQAFVSNENTSGTIQNRGSHQHSLVLRVRWNDFVLHRNASLFLFSFLSQYLNTEFKLSVRILCCHKRYLSSNCALNVNTQL